MSGYERGSPLMPWPPTTEAAVCPLLPGPALPVGVDLQRRQVPRLTSLHSQLPGAPASLTKHAPSPRKPPPGAGHLSSSSTPPSSASASSPPLAVVVPVNHVEPPRPVPAGAPPSPLRRLKLVSPFAACSVSSIGERQCFASALLDLLRIGSVGFRPSPSLPDFPSRRSPKSSRPSPSPAFPASACENNGAAPALASRHVTQIRQPASWTAKPAPGLPPPPNGPRPMFAGVDVTEQVTQPSSRRSSMKFVFIGLFRFPVGQ
ncbi:vegetative cell wall protein gp1-like isoform X2 [Triticum urartu]|uniref:vegetative cell wall protein gp1-like isoform X2 n=1 Tax=Triticum urartu TaxID=4572 RepID=UPI0020442B5A|nr:vegetative cell wall protein gp1-like isoform X2 [Triticum urartu]